jgi:hypothetical protein
MDGEALYMQLGRLIENAPNLHSVPWPIRSEVHQWLGRASALVREAGSTGDSTDFDRWVRDFLGPGRLEANLALQHIMALLYRALALAELRAPVATQGAFITAGSSFDAMNAVGKVLAMATQDVLIIDPYMDEKTLTDFAALAAERVAIRLLADQQTYKATLPANHR